MPRIEVAGDIYLRKPRPTHGSRTDDDDGDGDYDDGWWPKGSFYYLVT